MADRMKTIETLEQAKKAREDHEAPVLMSDDFMDVLIELLRENLPVEAELEGGGTTWWFVCGECHTSLEDRVKYCPECGRKVIWT